MKTLTPHRIAILLALILLAFGLLLSSQVFGS